MVFLLVLMGCLAPTQATATSINNSNFEPETFTFHKVKLNEVNTVK